jgi:hypothetical protein
LPLISEMLHTCDFKAIPAAGILQTRLFGDLGFCFDRIPAKVILFFVEEASLGSYSDHHLTVCMPNENESG